MADGAPGYARVARDAPALFNQNIAAALETVSRFIDPALDGSAGGVGIHNGSPGPAPRNLGSDEPESLSVMELPRPGRPVSLQPSRR